MSYQNDIMGRCVFKGYTETKTFSVQKPQIVVWTNFCSYSAVQCFLYPAMLNHSSHPILLSSTCHILTINMQIKASRKTAAFCKNICVCAYKQQGILLSKVKFKEHNGQQTKYYWTFTQFTTYTLSHFRAKNLFFWWHAT